MMENNFVFTPKNLLKNLHRLGGWSTFGLAEEAILHYHPELSDIEDSLERIEAMVKLTGKRYWQYWIKKYHKEIGYKGFNPACVNEY